MASLQKRLWILVAILCVLVAAGCSTSAAAPPASQPNAQRIRMVWALLSPQSPPDCEYRAPDDAATLDPEVLARLKLEYERHCYRQAETKARSRLRQLQVMVSSLHEFQIRHRRRFHRQKRI
jgi:hypothetical protein